ncbi:uncharacterized protein LOC143891672 [Tasmannia lanceolata]|uniref:uncharacterized protein LOC143891672 n=1 Tax=Tasmannia lanceolata TaxID=3420 RepID=UPI004062D8AC
MALSQGSTPRDNCASDFRTFGSTHLVIGLPVDLRSIGHSLSWNNRASLSERKYARLDRALVNDLWLQDFPLSFAAYRPPGISDHSAITVSLENQTSLGPKPFKFMSMWLDDVSVYPVVERAWANNCMGNPMYRLVYKLKEVKRQLVSWNKGIFGRIDVMLPIARRKLEDIQNQLAQNPADQRINKAEIEARDEFRVIARREGMLFKQKSRIEWLCQGDSNTKFFHAAVRTRNHLNHIMAMERED